MKRMMLAVAVLSLATFSSSANPKFRKSTKPARGMYIVVLEDADGPVDRLIENLAASHGGKVTHVLRGEPWQGYTVSGLPEAAALALSHDARVKVVEEDSLAVPLEVAPPQHAAWALDRTNQQFLPLDNTVGAGCLSSSTVHIYVVDTGISDPGGVRFGSRLIHGYRDPSLTTFADVYDSPRGHGTAVASIAGGITYGVASSANIVNVKVVGPNLGAGAVAAAIRNYINVHANSVAGPKVVNMSLHYPPTSTGYSQLEAEIQHSTSVYDITYVVGAGNDLAGEGRDACISGTPGRLGRDPVTSEKDNGIITVGAAYIRPASYSVDRRSIHPSGDGVTPSWASDYGACVDIFAPGTRVAAMNADGTEREFSGTSAATPYVAGAVARRLAYDWSVSQTVTAPEIIESMIKADSTPGLLTDPGVGSPNLLLRRVLIGRCRSS